VPNHALSRTNGVKQVRFSRIFLLANFLLWLAQTARSSGDFPACPSPVVFWQTPLFTSRQGEFTRKRGLQVGRVFFCFTKIVRTTNEEICDITK
jgi:hypothetical protein